MKTVRLHVTWLCLELFAFNFRMYRFINLSNVSNHDHRVNMAHVVHVRHVHVRNTSLVPCNCCDIEL